MLLSFIEREREREREKKMKERPECCIKEHNFLPYRDLLLHVLVYTQKSGAFRQAHESPRK